MKVHYNFQNESVPLEVFPWGLYEHWTEIKNQNLHSNLSPPSPSRPIWTAHYTWQSPCDDVNSDSGKSTVRCCLRIRHRCGRFGSNSVLWTWSSCLDSASRRPLGYCLGSESDCQSDWQSDWETDWESQTLYSCQLQPGTQTVDTVPTVSGRGSTITFITLRTSLHSVKFTAHSSGITKNSKNRITNHKLFPSLNSRIPRDKNYNYKKYSGQSSLGFLSLDP